MAENQVVVSGHQDMDYAEHEKTYRLFLKLMKWGAIHAVGILIFLPSSRVDPSLRFEHFARPDVAGRRSMRRL